MFRLDYNLVKVVWVDSYGCGSAWEPLSSLKAMKHECVSVGYIVKDNGQCLVVVPHISPENVVLAVDEQGCGEMIIPKVAVVSIQHLMEGKSITHDVRETSTTDQALE